MQWGRRFAITTACVTLAALAGCDSTTLAPRKSGVSPQERPEGLVPQAQAPAPAPTPVATPKPPPTARPAQTASQTSQDLARYYARVQADLLVRGLLRTDGGGPDTVFTDTMLARNFANVALADEYVPGQGLRRADASPGSVRKWISPVRMSAEFGPGVSPEKARLDSTELARYAAKLTRVTGHPISVSSDNPNFHVLFVSYDDMPSVPGRIRALVPDVTPSALTLFNDLPRDIHCLVYAFSDSPGSFTYQTVIAVIRSEHPDLLRKSCIHEEVAQGLGLGNDDPRARPSIFNDDDEFAFLTRHDELLLKILYDPRLTPGMSADAARPIVAEKATELLGGPS